jgi:superfamily II DNA or RNA helicase
MHTLLTYLGLYIDWKIYRQTYFSLEHKPFIPRPAWFPIEGWQKKMQKLIDEHCVIALMKDMVDVLPPEEYKIINLKPPKYETNIEWEATKQFVEDHRLEQHKKSAEIKKIAKDFRKAVVVAHYREQIDKLQKKLSNERDCFVLDGRTSDPQKVIADAESSPECYFIIQASVGAGFEIPSFSCMIFASQGYSVRNYVQMRARIRRINALKPVVYYFLHGGRCDKMVYKSIESGKDFVPSLYRDII